MLLDGRVATPSWWSDPSFTSRPSGADGLDRWRWLTGRQGHPADPEFAAYLRTTLDTLVLEGSEGPGIRAPAVPSRAAHGRRRASRAIANQADVLRRTLEPARFTERMWEAARNMIDVQSSHVQHSASRHYDLNRIGLSVAPDQVVVGLFTRRGEEIDPVEELVKREAFQRESVELATRMGDIIAGQVGNGRRSCFSSLRAPRLGRRNAKSRTLPSKSRRSAQTFRLSVHFGASVPTHSSPSCTKATRSRSVQRSWR